MGDAVLIVLIFAALFLFMLVFFSVRYRTEVGELIGHLRTFRLGPRGISVEFYEKAVLQKEGQRPPRERSEATMRRIGAGRILWIDDRPGNNELEIEALRDRGVEVDLARSNAEALDSVATDPARYDLVLSDIDRGDEGAKAGLELPPRLRAAGVEAPIAFYTGTVERPTTDLGDRVFASPSKLFDYIGEQLDGSDRGKAVRR